MLVHLELEDERTEDFYENAIKANENWFKVFWEPWFRTAVETKKVE
jgi:hypothetical protein